MVQVDQIPCRGGCRKPILQPGRLNRGTCSSIRFTRIAVNRKEMHRSPGEIVVALVAGQGEIIQIGPRVGSIPIVIAQSGEEAVRLRARAVSSEVRVNIIVIILTDIRVNGLRGAIRVVIISGGDDEIRVPGFDQVRNLKFGLTGFAEIANDSKADGAGRRRFYSIGGAGCGSRRWGVGGTRCNCGRRGIGGSQGDCRC